MTTTPSLEGVLAPGLTTRAPTDADFDEIFDVIIESDIEAIGVPDFTKDDLLDSLRLVSVEDDVRVVLDGARIVGYVYANPAHSVRMAGYVTTRPGSRGRGIGTWCTRWLEARSRACLSLLPDQARITLEQAAVATNATAHALLEHESFEAIRYFHRMTIEMDAPPRAPSWPAGVRVRTFLRGQDEHATHAAINESFNDHWGHVYEPFEQWRTRALERAGFDPSIWFLAVEGDEIAGVSICSDEPALGFINTVGVRRPWRRTGVALALLHHSFREFYRRGKRKVSLGVDAQSLTGATRLYDKAGMHVEHQFVLYSKELRPGEELATQELPE